MGQEEIINYLKKEKGWKTSNQITEAVKCSTRANVTRSLCKLEKAGEALRKTTKEPDKIPAVQVYWRAI